MMKPPINTEEALTIALIPPSEYEARVDRLDEQRRGEILKELERIAEAVATFAAYLDDRYGYGAGDQGHKSAVKHMNKVRRTLRKALGYTITKDLDI
jgi:hypothetical protein